MYEVINNPKLYFGNRKKSLTDVLKFEDLLDDFPENIRKKSPILIDMSWKKLLEKIYKPLP